MPILLLNLMFLSELTTLIGTSTLASSEIFHLGLMRAINCFSPYFCAKALTAVNSYPRYIVSSIEKGKLTSVLIIAKSRDNRPISFVL